MGYMHIENLYKNQSVLAFKEVWVLEKIHGTSAHIHFRKDGTITFSSGGASYDSFVKLFNETLLKINYLNYLSQFGASEGPDITVYGEAFGGKMQKMSDVYGPTLDFAVFEVSFSSGKTEKFLPVDKAVKVAETLGFKFVWHAQVSCDLETLNKYRDQPSQMGLAKGLGEHQSEGIVIRPLQEYLNPFGGRIIAKHKTDKFRETNTPRPIVDPANLKVLEEAQSIATEWVTEMRLTHILDKLPVESHNLGNTKKILVLMEEDIRREAANEIVWNPTVAKAINTATVQMFKNHLKTILEKA